MVLEEEEAVVAVVAEAEEGSEEAGGVDGSGLRADRIIVYALIAGLLQLTD